MEQDLPCDGAPGCCEKEDVDADKGDSCLLRSNIVHDDSSCSILARSCCPQDCDQELRDAHSYGPPKEDGPAPPLVNSVKAGECGGCVDTTSYQTNNKRIVESGILEELRAIVENEVDASELLKGLKETTSEQALEEVSFETIQVR